MVVLWGNIGIVFCVDIFFFCLVVVVEFFIGIIVLVGIWNLGNGVYGLVVVIDEDEIFFEWGVIFEFLRLKFCWR